MCPSVKTYWLFAFYLSTQTSRNMNNFVSTRLYFGTGRGLLIGDIPYTQEHSHHAMELFIGLKEEINLVSQGQQYASRVIILNSDIPHKLEASSHERIVIIVDPESKTAQNLFHQYLQAEPIFCFDNKQSDYLLTQIESYLDDDINAHQAENFCDQIINSFITHDDNKKPIDSRIIKVIEYLKTVETKKISVQLISDQVGLSESHLMHIFKEQVGIPIRRYLLWLRLLDAFNNLFDGCSLTHAAHCSGFADSAHLSRTFRKMFGLSISSIFKNRRFVQVISCLP